MTDERQAVKTLAEQLVKAMKSVSANTPSKNYTNGTTPSTISASKIVGLPAAFSSIINGVEDAAASGDAVAQMTLHALNHIAAGEFETITADTANIEKIYATFGDFITLVAEDATIGDLDVETIRAGLAEVGLINIGSASIDMAQIKRSSTQTAFIHESVQGKVYIDDLAVNDASIVNLSAGTVLINDHNGNLVELYVNDQGNVSTRAVSYDGTDIIDQNSLNGNRIIQNSITTAQLNASEIFAAQGTIMDLIADNINVTRLFANQGFINELETAIISSDLSQNTAIIELTDSIKLLAQNSNQTYIQVNQPIPAHLNDTWFNPATEQHYITAGFALFGNQFDFGHDNNGYLRNIHSDDYNFAINANGELAILVTNEDAEQLITDHNINFELVDNHLYSDNMWIEVENTAFSQLKISVEGITSEVYSIGYEVFDTQTGESKIAQNANGIAQNRLALIESSTRIDQNATDITLQATRTTNIINGTIAVPYVETSSVTIKNDKVEIKSTGDVDIKASNFSVSFNTEGSLPSKSRVDISNDVGIRVSDKYGGYFQANYDRIGLYDMLDTPRLYMDANGQAFFNGSLTLGGVRNTDGSLTIRNENGTRILFANKNGMEIYNSTGMQKQFYLDSSTGDATFAGVLNAASGSFAGELSSSIVSTGSVVVGGGNNGKIIIKNTSNVTTGEWGTDGFTLYDNSGLIPQMYMDRTTGKVMFAGELSAASGTFAGTMDAACITSGKITSEYIDSTGLKVNAANITGTLIIGQLPDTVAETSDIPTAVSQLTNDSDFQNATQVTTITENTITTTNVLAQNLQVNAANITGTLSANKIVGGNLNIGGNGAQILISNSSGQSRGLWTETQFAVYCGDQLRMHITDSMMVIYSNGIPKLIVDNNGNATFAGELSAACITSGTMAADHIKGGTLTLGGYGNGNGIVTVLNASNAVIGTINQNGISMQGTLKTTTNSSNIYTALEAGSLTYYKPDGSGAHSVGFMDYSAGQLQIRGIYATVISGDMAFLRFSNTTAALEGSLTVSQNETVSGTLTVTGTKSRLVSTSQYSDRLLYCYETPSPLFGDVGEGVISSDGQCYIPLDPIFAQTISTDQYQVFLQRYGEGDCYVSERHGSYFIVKGTPNLPFGWEIKAKQSDFDQLRLERNDEKFSVPEQTYGEEAASHLQELYNERAQQDNQQDNQESEE